MSKAAELIADLSEDGEFDSDGGFSLDREKARQKMRQFQLADPHRYVLLLVEAAVLRGATRIDFEIDSDDMHMRFDAALSYEDLDELYSALFVDRSQEGIRARRELALACNAVMALNPRWVRIESFASTGEGGVLGLLQPEAEDEISRLEEPPAGLEPLATHIHVKDRFRPGLLVRFVNDLRGTIPEELLIRQHCCYASTPISLDGEQVSYGLPQNLVSGIQFETEGLRGVAGLHPGEGPRSAVVLMSNGVRLTTHDLRDCSPGMWFWVDGSDFRKDVSQADIVRSDPVYQQMLVAIGEARNEVLARLVRDWHDETFSDQTEPTSDEVFNLLRAAFLRWATPAWLRPEAGPLGELGRMRLWRTVDRRWISPWTLSGEIDLDRGVMYTTRDFGGVMPEGWGVVIHAIKGDPEVAAIERIYPGASDATAELEREVPWELNRRKWRARTHAVELPRGAWPDVVEFEHEELRGQLALRPGRLSDVRVVVDGCLLTEYEIDLGFIGLCAVITGPFEPIRDYTRPRRERNFARALLLVLGQLRRAVAAWAQSTDGESGDQLRRLLLALARPDLVPRWLEAFGFSSDSARSLLERIGTPRLLPDFGLVRNQPTAVARRLCFTTVDQRIVDLVAIDLDRRVRERLPGKVLIIDRAAPRSPVVNELLLHVDEDERRLLTMIFGIASIHDDTHDYVRERGRRAFEAKPQQSPEPPRSRWSVAVEHGGIRGFVGLEASELRGWKMSEPHRARIEVRVDGRLLCQVEERVPLAGVEASLDWPEASINRTWDGLSGSKAPLREAVEHGLAALIREQAAAVREIGVRPNDDLRRLLWHALALPFVDHHHFEAWRRLRASGDHEAAVRDYLELRGLFPGLRLHEIRQALDLLFEADTRPTAKQVLELVTRESKRSSEPASLVSLLLERVEELEQVPLVRGVDGRLISLAELIACRAEHGEIAVVRDPSLSWEGDERLIVSLDEIDSDALTHLFGREILIDASEWIYERRHQLRFASREQLEEIKLREASRLVSVEFEHEGVHGEIAIPPWTPSQGGKVKVTICHERRIVEDVTIHGSLPVVVILDDPEAQLSRDLTRVEVTGSRMVEIRKLIAELTRDRLLHELADRYEELGEREQVRAREWIFAHWRAVSPRAGALPKRLTEAGKRFAALKLFADVDGTPRSLDELIGRYKEQGCLWICDGHPGLSVPPAFPVLDRRPHEAEILQFLFPELQDYEPRWRDHVEGVARRERARVMPAISSPPPVVEEVRFDRQGMEGVVWIPEGSPFDSGVLLGSAGKLVEVVQPIAWLPCQGIVDGEIATDDRFEHAALDGGQRRYLDSRVVYLYSQLLNHHRRDLARSHEPDFMAPERVRLRGLRIEALAAAVIALTRARREGAAFDAILGNLYGRLAEQPLLRLASGRMVSVETARQARPRELAHLELWDPNAPALEGAEHARLLLGESQPAQPSGRARVRQAEAASPEVTAKAKEPAGDEASHEVEALGGPEFELSAVLELEPLDLEQPEPPEEPEIDRVGLVLDRVREELRLLRERHEIVLSEGLLDQIGARPGRGKDLVAIDEGVVFDSEHPRFERATTDPDPIWISFLASVAYTALNRWLEEVTDDDELAFHGGHAQLLLSGLVDAAE